MKICEPQRSPTELKHKCKVRWKLLWLTGDPIRPSCHSFLSCPWNHLQLSVVYLQITLAGFAAIFIMMCSCLPADSLFFQVYGEHSFHMFPTEDDNENNWAKTCGKEAERGGFHVVLVPEYFGIPLKKDDTSHWGWQWYLFFLTCRYTA